MRAILCAILFGIAPMEANAQAVGLGARTCAQFAKEYLEAHDVAEPLYFTYTQGYMTALTMLFEVLKKPTVNLIAWPSEQQKAHIRKFCSEHPDAAFVFAAQNLFEALQKVSRKNSN